MLKVFYFMAGFVLVAAATPRHLIAQVRARPERPHQNCLEKADKKIRPDKPISVFRTDGSQFKGRFVSVDLGQSLLNVRPLNAGDTSFSSFRISEIAKIKYDKGGRLKRMGIGLLVGGGLGALVGSSQGDLAPFSGGAATTAATGAVGGGIIGLLVGLILPSGATIECK
ncbi:MAG: hypothetical protein L0Z48_07185 [candidate division Zixibacteria bacterium]|nr:hypothetical protein [candidate division Zixibacteria bacterium]